MYIIRYKRGFIIRIGLNGVSQVAQVIKNPPGNAGAMGVADSILGWEDPLEEEMATHSSILAWKIIWTEDLVGYSPWEHKESDTPEQLSMHACSMSMK